MVETTELTQLAVRAADLADLCEVAGELVSAALLRDLARDVEEVVLETQPPDVGGWMESGRASARPS